MSGRSATVIGTCFILGCVALGLLVCLRVPGTDPTSSQVGRYQISGVPGHMFVLDTATGRLWEKFVPEGSFATTGFSRIVLPPSEPLLNDMSDADAARRYLEEQKRKEIGESKSK